MKFNEFIKRRKQAKKHEKETATNIHIYCGTAYQITSDGCICSKLDKLKENGTYNLDYMDNDQNIKEMSPPLLKAYLEIPIVVNSTDSTYIPKDVMTLLKQTKLFISNSEIQFALSHIEIKDNTINASNGHILYSNKIKHSLGNFYIPGYVLDILIDAKVKDFYIKEINDYYVIHYNNDKTYIIFNKITENSYPDFSRVIRKPNMDQGKVIYHNNIKDKKAKLIHCTNNNTVVKDKYGEEIVTLTESVISNIPDDTKIMFNLGLLKIVCKTLKKDCIELFYGDDMISPFNIYDNNLTLIVMPMRKQNGKI